MLYTFMLSRLETVCCIWMVVLRSQFASVFIVLSRNALLLSTRLYYYSLRCNRVFCVYIYIYIYIFLFQCKGISKLLLRLSKFTYNNFFFYFFSFFFSAFITCVICYICQCWKLCTMYTFEIKFVLFCSVSTREFHF